MKCPLFEAAPYGPGVPGSAVPFSDKGRERGLAVELVRDFERYINVKYVKQLGKRPLTIYVVPATRDKLLPDLGGGLTDIAVGNLTVTEERQTLADFVPGDDGRRIINKVVVSGPTTPALVSLDDLAGKTVHVRKASSYHDSLLRLNERLARDGKAPVALVLVPDSLEDEDMLDMLDAGLFRILVVDNWKARMWVQVLPKLKVRTDLVLRADAKTGWAIRKHSPQLAAEIDDFASYNCGPGNVAKARRAAEGRGLDPNKWFNNVEIVVAQQIGTETTTYVRNIYKYYVAYRLTLDAQEQAEKARQQVVPAKN